MAHGEKIPLPSWRDSAGPHLWVPELPGQPGGALNVPGRRKATALSPQSALRLAQRGSRWFLLLRPPKPPPARARTEHPAQGQPEAPSPRSSPPSAPEARGLQRKLPPLPPWLTPTCTVFPHSACIFGNFSPTRLGQNRGRVKIWQAGSGRTTQPQLMEKKKKLRN